MLVRGLLVEPLRAGTYSCRQCTEGRTEGAGQRQTARQMLLKTLLCRRCAPYFSLLLSALPEHHLVQGGPMSCGCRHGQVVQGRRLACVQCSAGTRLQAPSDLRRAQRKALPFCTQQARMQALSGGATVLCACCAGTSTQALSDLCALVQGEPLPPGTRQALGRAVMSPWQAAASGLGPMPCSPGRGLAQPGATLVLQALDESPMQACTQLPPSGALHCNRAVPLTQQLLMHAVPLDCTCSCAVAMADAKQV